MSPQCYNCYKYLINTYATNKAIKTISIHSKKNHKYQFNAVTKTVNMEFRKSVYRYFAAFFYLGQLPCLATHTTHRCIISCYIYLCINTSISVWLSTYCIYMINTMGHLHWSHTDSVIISIISTCEYIRVLSILVQIVLYKRDFQQIFETFRKLERFYLIHFSHAIRYSKFRKTITIRFLIILAAYTPQLVFFIYKYNRFNVNKEYRCIVLASKCLQFIKLIYIFNNIFYVELLNFYFAELIHVIRKDVTNDVIRKNIVVLAGYSGSELLRRKMKLYKTVHFELWETGQRISQLFGWSQIATAIYEFIEFVYANFHVVVKFHMPWKPLTIMGN